MSELQNDPVDSEAIEPAIENQENGTDLAPVSEAEHEAQPQVDEEAEAKIANNEAIQKRINKEHFEKQQAKREAAEYKQKLEAYESKQREELAAQVKDIPPMPDAFDDDFEVKVQQRDQALLRKAEFDAQQNYYTQQEQFNQQQAAQARQLEQQKILQEHNDRVKTLGIKQEAMLAAENTVMSYGLPNELLTHIAAMKDSPLVINHLAANPVEGYELASLVTNNPYAVGSYLDEINSKASALKPKTSSAPSPATNLQGNGVDPEAGKYKNIKGAKFE